MTECTDWPSIPESCVLLYLAVLRMHYVFKEKAVLTLQFLFPIGKKNPTDFFKFFLCVCEWEISDCRNNFQHNDFLDLSECHPSSRVPSAWPDQEKSHRYLWSLRPDGFPGEAGHGTQGHRRPGALYRGEERYYQHWIIFNRSLLISNLKSLCKQMCFEIFN